MSVRFPLCGFEFAYLGEDLCEPVGEPVKALAVVVVWERAAEHLQRVLGGEEGIDEAVEPGAELWRRGLWLWRQMPGFGAGQLELAFEIGEGDIDVAHGHLGVDVAEQLHQNGEADAGAKHLRGVGMPELVGDDACGEAEGVADPMQVIAELDNDGHFASRTCNEPSICGQRIERAEEAQSVNEVAD